MTTNTTITTSNYKSHEILQITTKYYEYCDNYNHNDILRIPTNTTITMITTNSSITTITTITTMTTNNNESLRITVNDNE